MPEACSPALETIDVPQGFAALAMAAPGEAAPAAGPAFVPPVPQSLDELGVTPLCVESLLLKILYTRGEVIGRDLADALGLKFSLIERLLEAMKARRFVEVKASLGFGAVSSVFALSDAGRNRARECLEENQYAGAVPVPLPAYVEAVRKQRCGKGWVTRELLAQAYKHMTVSPRVLSQIGPAVNSGKSFLLYGEPGNGKTYLAEALFNVAASPIFIPHAVECEGTIVRIFDSLYHERLDSQESSISAFRTERTHDARWALCRRPFITSGGELTTAMLELSFNATSRTYDAPFHVKANNGIYLIDDFGRQKASPAEVLNRWIIPMERRVDYLTFQTGGKVEVPFETFLVFSTNLKPENLGDEAFLRRIQYKMFVASPDRDEYAQIFRKYCQSQSFDVPPGMLEEFIQKHYDGACRPFRRCHPRDIINHAIDLIAFERLPSVLTADVLNRAVESCFTA